MWDIWNTKCWVCDIIYFDNFWNEKWGFNCNHDNKDGCFNLCSKRVSLFL